MYACVVDPRIPEVDAIALALASNEGTGQQFSPTHWMDKVFKVGSWVEDNIPTSRLKVYLECQRLIQHACV